MNDIMIFNNEEFGKIRTVEIDNEVWFVASDICKSLEIANTTQAVQKLEADEKSMLNIGLSGGATNCINEYGLYSLVLTSRKPEAKKFKHWVTHEVLPSIRKTGGYRIPHTVGGHIQTVKKRVRSRIHIQEHKTQVHSRRTRVYRLLRSAESYRGRNNGSQFTS